MQRAGDGIRTHDNHLGKVVLYQLSYTRIELDLPATTPQICGSAASLKSRNYRFPKT